jgi:peroxiredoxin
VNKWHVPIVGLMFAAALSAQDSPQLAAAKALDKRIEKVNDLPEAQRVEAIRILVRQIREQPQQYRRALADNLAISSSEATPPDVLQEVVDTLVAAIRDLPPLSRDYSDEYQHLAEFARYSHLHVSLTDPRYMAALLKLEEIDRHLEQTDFLLTDLGGHQWSLKKLQGKVVLVNFWATWCPPCVRELGDLEATYRRFESTNFVLIAITDEDASTVKKFLADHPLSYPILLDPGGIVKKDFGVTGIPKSFVFGRDGRLVAETIDRPTEKQLLDMLGQAGLR